MPPNLYDVLDCLWLIGLLLLVLLRDKKRKEKDK